MLRLSLPSGVHTLFLTATIVGFSLIPGQRIQAAPSPTERLAGTGPTLATTFVNVAPTGAGTITTSEWGTPTEILLNGLREQVNTRNALLNSMSTATDLYIAISFAEPVANIPDSLEIDFDSDHDGVATAGAEDGIIYALNAVDQHWRTTAWETDIRQDGDAARTYVDGRYQYEFRKPLRSGDTQDMNVALGDILGFRLQIYDAQTDEHFRYPFHTKSQGDTSVEWPKWGNLMLSTGITTPPKTLDPADASVLSAMTTQLDWLNPAGTTQVHLQIIPANNDGPGVNLILENSTSFNVPAPPTWYGLLPGMTYTWRVQATAKQTFAPENDPTWGPWSSGSTFRTPTRRATRVLIVSPEDGGTILATSSQLLRWQNTDSDVFYYEIQVSTDPNFGEQGAVAAVWANLIHGGVSNPTNSWQTLPLAEKTTYYWRVRPRIQGDGTPTIWDKVWSFKTR